jgi:hypothetical protein
LNQLYNKILKYIIINNNKANKNNKIRFKKIIQNNYKIKNYRKLNKFNLINKNKLKFKKKNLIILKIQIKKVISLIKDVSVHRYYKKRQTLIKF